MPGTLFVVATPIGNLEDITLRALRILREVDVIAAEDTRRSSKLLARYEIRKPLCSLREHNEARQGATLIARLAAGESVALVTDAGTPGIADPGARFVAASREAGIPVVPIPGPSAVTTALSVSGFAASQFTFMGYPPASGSARSEWFERFTAEDQLVVMFEAPHRLKKTLKDIAIAGKQPILVFSELTKIHETLVVQSNTDSIDELEPKGEYLIVVGPRKKVDPEPKLTEEAAAILFGHLTDIDAIDEDLATRLVATAAEVSERVAAKLVKKGKILVKRGKTART